MSANSLQSLSAQWKSAQHGRLCAWEMAKALALREASKEIHGGKLNVPWIAARVTKQGGGSPAPPSLHELYAKVDADPDWYPGKHNGEKRGPKPLFNSAKRRCVALNAMTSKENKDQEPCVAASVLACPKATWNPKTKRPFCDKTIRKVYTTQCYDFDPAKPWRFQNALQKVFLPQPVREHCLSMCRYLLRYGPAATWWSQHVVWFDPCSCIIPGNQKQYREMIQALKGKKRYISDDAKLYSPNMPGPDTALKQRQWGGTKINWFMVLTRGVVHVEVMPPDWRLEGLGLAAFVRRLETVLRKMLGDAPLPRHIFTDRGTGMYIPKGTVVRAYSEAVQAQGFHLHWGEDATRQSPDMPDLLLHETAVSWFRKGMKKERPEVLPWLETQAQWTKRARKVVAHINATHDVAGLCREFPQRLRSVVDGEGERLRK